MPHLKLAKMSMKYSDLTDNMRQEIMGVICDKLLKLGIQTEVTMDAKVIYNGKELVSVLSKSFNTTPVIYKSIIVKCEGFICDTDKENVFSLTLNIDYKFYYFSGAENGVNIGSIVFYLYPDTDRVANIGLTI